MYVNNRHERYISNIKTDYSSVTEITNKIAAGQDNRTTGFSIFLVTIQLEIINHSEEF